MSPDGLLLGLIARIPPDGIATFNAYEAQVLPLLADHGGVLQRRLRTDDGQTEIHLVWFPSEAAFAAFREDPRRTQHAALMTQAGAATELLRLRDVTDPPLMTG